MAVDLPAVGEDPWGTKLNTAITGIDTAKATILTGGATPAAGTGAVGDYYLDTTNHVLYGPKTAGGVGYGTPQTLFGSQVPSDWMSGTQTWGVDITCAKAGRITGIRYNRSVNSSAGKTSSALPLYSSGGALLATGTTTGETGSGWQTATLATPVVVTAGQVVRACVNLDNSAGTHAGMMNMPLLPVVSGDLSNGTGTSRATGSGLGYPNINQPSVTAFVDVVYQPEVVLAIWPVAVYGVPPGGTTGQYLKKTSGADYAIGWVT